MAQTVKNLPECRTGFDPWIRKTPGEGNCNLLQHSCLENPTDRGAWQATVHGVIKSQTQVSFHFSFKPHHKSRKAKRQGRSVLCLGGNSRRRRSRGVGKVRVHAESDDSWDTKGGQQTGSFWGPLRGTADPPCSPGQAPVTSRYFT